MQHTTRIQENHEEKETPINKRKETDGGNKDKEQIHISYIYIFTHTQLIYSQS